MDAATVKGLLQAHLEDCEFLVQASRSIDMQDGVSFSADPRSSLRNTDGGLPNRRANKALKLPRLEKPTAKQTSVTESSVSMRRCLAFSRRDRVRNRIGVSPNTALNCLTK